MKVAELEGALLDLWVARAGEVWTWAHELFPTMTLDPTFVSAGLFPEDGRDHCFLVPNNPMRQGYVEFSPSTSWEIAGPIIEREFICLNGDDGAPDVPASWDASIFDDGEVCQTGPTPLIAAMRAFVAWKFGDEVPDGVTS